MVKNEQRLGFISPPDAPVLRKMLPPPSSFVPSTLLLVLPARLLWKTLSYLSCLCSAKYSVLVDAGSGNSGGPQRDFACVHGVDVSAPCRSGCRGVCLRARLFLSPGWPPLSSRTLTACAGGPRSRQSFYWPFRIQIFFCISAGFAVTDWRAACCWAEYEA